mgnify:FL=1
MNIIDIIILVILGLSLVAGMYKGFLASMLSLFVFCGAWVGAYATYGFLASTVSNNVDLMNIFKNLIGAADLFKTPELANLDVVNATAANIDQAVNEIGIPLISDLFRGNVSGQVFANQGLTKMYEYLNQTLLTSILNVLSFIIMFAIIYIAVLLLVNLLNNVFRFPELRHLDWFLGGVFGLVRGAVIVMLIFAVLPALSSGLHSMKIDVLSDLLAGSTFATILQDNNFVSGLITTLLK